MTAPELQLETERLILRPPRPEDLEPWCAFSADEETMRHLGGVQSRSVAWRGLCQVAGAWTIEGFSMFSVIEKASGRWIGRLGPWRPADWSGDEIGWGIFRPYWRRGYAVEGASAAMDYAVDVLGWDEIIHCIDPANLASQGVARRLGSRVLRLGRMPAPYDEHEVEIWGQTAQDWRARRGA